MKINPENFNNWVTWLMQHQCLSPAEAIQVRAIIQPDFPFASQLAIADTLHLHIHTAHVDQLPHQALLDQKAVIEYKTDGYIKYAFPEGINLIFSQGKTAQDAPLGNAEPYYLDHIGIDIRADTKEAYLIFQEIPLQAARQDYSFTRQGGSSEGVQCCYAQVKEKYWVYPDQTLNYELAFGPLKKHGSFGVDVRPANPFRVTTGEKVSDCCSVTQPTGKIFMSVPKP